MTDNKPKFQPILGRGVVWWLAVLGGILLGLLVLVVVFLIVVVYVSKELGYDLRANLADIPCVSIAERFDKGKFKLPRRIGCWRLNMTPTEFSDPVHFPENVNFDLDWQVKKGTLVRVRNKFGKDVVIDPRIANALGVNNEGNEVLRFKGQGSVEIKIVKLKLK